MLELFSSELGLMISALLVFAGISDFMIITLFLSRETPRMRMSDEYLSPEQKDLIKTRTRRHKIMQFSLAMSGLLLLVAGLYGMAIQIIGKT
jgi:hypothetical protein